MNEANGLSIKLKEYIDTQVHFYERGENAAGDSMAPYISNTLARLTALYSGGNIPPISNAHYAAIVAAAGVLEGRRAISAAVSDIMAAVIALAAT